MHSFAELQARLRMRDATEPPPTPARSYRVDDSIIAEIHRTRDRLEREQETEALMLNETPPRRKK